MFFGRKRHIRKFAKRAMAGKVSADEWNSLSPDDLREALAFTEDRLTVAIEDGQADVVQAEADLEQMKTCLAGLVANRETVRELQKNGEVVR